MTLQSIDLSPFWLGMSYLLRKISITNRTVESKSGNVEGILSSGTPGMKHVACRDEKSNYFVLKKAKKEANQQDSSEQ